MADETISLAALEESESTALRLETGASKYTELEGLLTSLKQNHMNARRKSGVDEALVESLYSTHSEYIPTKRAKLLEQGMSTTFFGVTEEKIIDALSWLSDVFLGETDKPWRLKPTPIPRVPADLQQVALMSGVKAARDFVENLGREPEETDIVRLRPLVRQTINDTLQVEAIRRSKDMEKEMSDQLVEGNWVEAFQDLLFDLITTKACILKGPIYRERQVRSWEDGKVSYKWETVPTFSRVSPFDAYPSASSVQFEGDFIERTRYTLADIFWMKKQKHYSQEQVELVEFEFETKSGGDVNEIDSEVAPILRGQTGEEQVAGTVEGMIYWLTLTGTKLREKGWTKFPVGNKEIKPGKLYHVEMITVGGRVVLFLENTDLRGRKPYYKTGWQTIPGSFWYRSLPEILKDIQDVCNASARSLVNNMGLSSGFQIVISDINRVVAGTKLTTAFPHKLWQFRNPGNSSLPPLDFKQPQSNANELIGILEKFREWADVRSGIPKYLLGGEPPPGVGRTASGISMLLNSAAKGIRRVVLNVDRNVVCPLLKTLYDSNLENQLDVGLLGDAEIVPAGAVETLMKADLAERRLGLLDAITKSPDAGLVSLRGRAGLWREAFRGAEMDVTTVIESVEKVEQQAEVAAVNQKAQADAERQAAEADMQTKQMNAQAAQLKLQIEQQRLKTEFQLHQLKLQAQIAENEQRSSITKRMAANADLKTAQEIGSANVPTREELQDDLIRDEFGGAEEIAVPTAEPSVQGAGGEVTGVPSRVE